ncbi:MAG: hypothetical protein AVDCRST_MAG75-1135 [uncultured Propionibacteriaceae bacterium]|uniref:NADPH-dependent FMN reductase-like domain-containing protein n=1 Tax=uncultured Propionibacteriaceae bacterium TaxID=257457 RepID=A0A6J4NCB5_9ACTN|nr:MAG: hypothetical protein AVDCRST_MAG75-1135 [uncultured Propionibacteriaceae bacterium]
MSNTSSRNHSPGANTPRNILVISGSSRPGSLNSQLAGLVADLRAQDAVTLVTDLSRLPFYDADLEAGTTPAAVVDLRAAVTAAELVVIVTPEYNGTIPGLLGNAIDWLSRPRGESTLRDKPLVVLSASPGQHGGTRAAGHLRAVLQRIGAAVLPTGLSVAEAHHRLSSSSPDPQLVTALSELLAEALELPAEAMSA